MPPRRRLTVLLTALAVSLTALYFRDAIQSRLYGAPPGLETARTVGAEAPELPTLVTIDGGAAPTLASLRGRVVLLHFWAFSCSNCDHMLPHYDAWDREFGARGLTVLGVHSPETAQERDVGNLRAFVRARGIRWRVLMDPDFAAWNRYRVEAWPTSVLIDRVGRIRGVFVGDGEADRVHAALARVVAER